ncbi:unnamed protein product, partial [Prunus brigantina]
MWDSLPCLELLLVAWSNMTSHAPNDGRVPKAEGRRPIPNHWGDVKTLHAPSNDGRVPKASLLLNNDRVPKASLLSNDEGVPKASLTPNDGGVPKE